MLNTFQFHCTECEKPFEIREAQIIKCPDCETFYDTENNRLHNDFEKGDMVEVWSQRQHKMVEAMFFRKSKLHKQFSVVYIPSERQETHRIAYTLPELRPIKLLETLTS